MPFVEDIGITADLPHTISYVITYATKITSFNELPKDKQPPRGIWDKPHRLEEFFDEVFDVKNTDKKTTSIEFDPEEVE